MFFGSSSDGGDRIRFGDALADGRVVVFAGPGLGVAAQLEVDGGLGDCEMAFPEWAFLLKVPIQGTFEVTENRIFKVNSKWHQQWANALLKTSNSFLIGSFIGLLCLQFSSHQTTLYQTKL